MVLTQLQLQLINVLKKHKKPQSIEQMQCSDTLLNVSYYDIRAALHELYNDKQVSVQLNLKTCDLHYYLNK